MGGGQVVGGWGSGWVRDGWVVAGGEGARVRRVNRWKETVGWLR